MFSSYSHVRVDHLAVNITYSQKILEVVVFAGEATTRQYAATMHGDYFSGLKEASHISKSMKARQNNPKKIVCCPPKIVNRVDTINTSTE